MEKEKMTGKEKEMKKEEEMVTDLVRVMEKETNYMMGMGKD